MLQNCIHFFKSSMHKFRSCFHVFLFGFIPYDAWILVVPWFETNEFFSFTCIGSEFASIVGWFEVVEETMLVKVCSWIVYLRIFKYVEYLCRWIFLLEYLYGIFFYKCSGCDCICCCKTDNHCCFLYVFYGCSRMVFMPYDCDCSFCVFSQIVEVLACF